MLEYAMRYEIEAVATAHTATARVEAVQTHRAG